MRALTDGRTDVTARLLDLLADVRAGRPLERLVIKTPSRVYFVRVDEIDRIEAAGHYVAIHSGREEHLMRTTIREIASRLDPARFVSALATLAMFVVTFVPEPLKFIGDFQ